mgnify:CR=1 FL=1
MRTFVDTPEMGQLRIRNDLKFIVEDGKIISIGQDIEAVGELFRIPSGAFVCPGFIDLHCHAPQFPNKGIGCDGQVERSRAVKDVEFIFKMGYSLGSKSSTPQGRV